VLLFVLAGWWLALFALDHGLPALSDDHRDSARGSGFQDGRCGVGAVRQDDPWNCREIVVCAPHGLESLVSPAVSIIGALSKTANSGLRSQA
jgi:hypothetical protein